MSISVPRLCARLGVCAFLLGLAGCGPTDDRDFKTAEASNKPAAYEAFLLEHPEGVLARRARARIADPAFMKEQSLQLGAMVLAMSPYAPKERSYVPANEPSWNFGSTFSATPAAKTLDVIESEADLAAIRLLLEEGADSNGVVLVPESNEDDRSLLVIVPHRRMGYWITLVNFCQNDRLLPKTGRLVQRQLDGAYKLAQAARTGDLTSLQTLAGTDQANPERAGALRGALLLAVRNGYVDAVRTLLELGADPLALCSEAATPIVEAIAREDREILALLLTKVPPGGKLDYLTGSLPGEFNGQAVLARIALEDADAHLREGAARRITDPVALGKVAAETKDSRIQVFATAVLQLGPGSEAARPAEAALFSRDRLTRKAAVERLEDEPLLAAIARDDPLPAVRGAAVLKLTNPQVLAEIACRETDAGVYAAAFARVTDQAGIAHVAFQHPDWTIRAAAIGKLSDPALLAKAVSHDSDPEIRWLATGRLTALRMTDQADLASTAIAAQDFYTSRAAVMLLTEQPLLARVATKSANWIIRSAAVNRLTDPTLIASLAAGCTDYLVRQAAIAKLTEQPLLARLIVAEREVAVRRNAIEQLTDPSAVEAIGNDAEVESVVRFARRRHQAQRVRALQEILRERFKRRSNRS